MQLLITKFSPMLSKDQVAATVRSRESYWRAIVRNKYSMPALKQPICTIKWMQGVRDGLYWCPRGELAMRQIASAPTKQQLADILMEAVD